MQNKLEMSALNKTWLLDIDGTIVKHNGYKIDGIDTLLAGAKDFLDSLPENDKVVLLTSRTNEYRKETLDFLKNNGIRYDEIIFGLPLGERILVNDMKPSGLKMAYSINSVRDEFIKTQVVINDSI